MELIVEFSECLIDFFHNYKDLINLSLVCKSYANKTRNLRNHLKDLSTKQNIKFRNSICYDSIKRKNSQFIFTPSNLKCKTTGGMFTSIIINYFDKTKVTSITINETKYQLHPLLFHIIRLPKVENIKYVGIEVLNDNFDNIRVTLI